MNHQCNIFIIWLSWCVVLKVMARNGLLCLIINIIVETNKWSKVLLASRQRHTVVMKVLSKHMPYPMTIVNDVLNISSMFVWRWTQPVSYNAHTIWYKRSPWTYVNSNDPTNKGWTLKGTQHYLRRWCWYVAVHIIVATHQILVSIIVQPEITWITKCYIDLLFELRHRSIMIMIWFIINNIIRYWLKWLHLYNMWSQWITLMKMQLLYKIDGTTDKKLYLCYQLMKAGAIDDEDWLKNWY